VNRRARRWRWLGPLLLVATGILLVVGLTWGAVAFSPGDLWTALTGGTLSKPQEVALATRVPRGIVALIAGASLATAGCLLQATTRNPLASPEITSITQGALAAVVLWTAFGPVAGGAVVWLLPAIATVGGLTAAAVVYAVALRGASTESNRFLVTGILVGGILTAVTSLGLLFLGERVVRIIAWQSGSLSSTTWTDVQLMAPYAALGVALTAFGLARANVLQLGPDVARALGQRREADQLLVILAAVVATAGVVAVVGALGFVGLVAPHLTRRWVGSDLRRLVPAAALTGAILVLGADVLARNLFATGPGGALPVGVYLSLIGIPYILVLIRNRRTEPG
jgi:iron complex transport system permease protein